MWAHGVTRSDLTKSDREFVKYFRPRLERSAQLSLYTRAHDDTRPASIAHPTATESQWASVALSQTLSTSMMLSDATMPRSGSVPIPHRLIPVGEKRNVFQVTRLREHEYRFEQKGRVLEPPVGYVLDTDTVLQVVEKLHHRYPMDVPLTVYMGEAVAPGRQPTRHVRNTLESKGTALVETQPIGLQTLRTDFSKNFHARAERVAKVNLAARARPDGRPDAIAFLKPGEYMQRSTFSGVF